MVKIRLKQTGKKNNRQYRIIATESASKRDGKTLEVLGHYNPIPDKSIVKLNVESAEKWVSNGAIMTERVKKLYDLVKNNKIAS